MLISHCAHMFLSLQMCEQNESGGGWGFSEATCLEAHVSPRVIKDKAMNLGHAAL